MPVKAYLGRTMLRRVLTCLALITGLAAVGAPASAALIEALSEQVDTRKSQQQQGSTEDCECRGEHGTATNKRERLAKCKPRKPVTIYIPTVQFGADRAFE